MPPLKRIVNTPEKPFEPLVAANDNGGNTPAIAMVPALDFDETEIPLRQWIIPGLLIRRHLSVLVAPPGAGKSLLTLQLALATARGEEWGGFVPRYPSRVLVVNSEDDVDEMRRRLAASVRSMGINKGDIADRIFLADDPSSIVVARTDPKSKTVTRMPLVDELIAAVRQQRIDVLVVDPFAETFEGDENSNSEVKWAAAIWREVARQTDCAVLLVHHVSKAGSSSPGDMNAARGGGALVGVARSVSTLFAMSEGDAKVMGVEDRERHMFVRFDDAKANLTLVTGQAKWFRKETVRLNNGTATQHGDDVGVLHPWQPPSVMEGLTIATINLILDDLSAGFVDEHGEVTGVPCSYTDTKRGPRWGGHVVIRHCEMEPARAAKVLKTWKDNGVIDEVTFYDEADRKDKKGIRVIEANRPGKSMN
ncbi:AAA family ATPase [Devosia salina]|uniref:Helicase RepA family protein n=1 Tax=Devosia salina TaxID=2860336 RepID=A0ABX8W8N2_9HYPH|nr:AAA family ATPase [Devosia salina]QYO75325.1 helicase RepA family protein [Devosia salina]